MSIITRTGDAGTTSLMYGRRVPKTEPRVEAYGTVDELNASLGVARAAASAPGVGDRVLAVQRDLVVLMGELATHPDDLARYERDGFQRVTAVMTSRLDDWGRELEAVCGDFKGWATPGSTVAAAAFDLSRTVCRRAERRACALHECGQLHNAEILVFLNRLSDVLWLVARCEERGVPS